MTTFRIWFPVVQVPLSCGAMVEHQIFVSTDQVSVPAEALDDGNVLKCAEGVMTAAVMDVVLKFIPNIDLGTAHKLMAAAQVDRLNLNGESIFRAMGIDVNLEREAQHQAD